MTTVDSPASLPVRDAPRLGALDWILRIVPAAIMLQTLVFKFTGAPEPVWIFEQLGAEPWGRLASGLAEALASSALLLPPTAAFGALATVVLMLGAVCAHLTVLGIDVAGDGGALFGMALVSLACASIVCWRRRSELPLIGARFRR